MESQYGTFTRMQTAFLLVCTLLFSAGGWYLLGKYYFCSDLDRKRIDAQLDYYQEKVNQEPANAEYRINLGYTYYLLGRNNKAIQELKQALALDEKNFAVYYNLGLVYRDEENYDDALAMFDQAARLAPRDYKPHLQKGIVYRKLQMYPQAYQALEQADRLLPKSADIIFEIWQVAEAEGKIEQAIAIYKEVLTYDPLFKDAARALERLETKNR